MAEPRMAGCRPSGFFAYELKCLDHFRWEEQIRELLERDLIDAAEANWIEDSYSALSGDQSPDLYASFETAAGIQRMRLGAYRLRSMLREFELARAWHVWRGRPELADRYQRRAAAVRGALGSAA